MPNKPKDHTKTINTIKKTVNELKKSVNGVAKNHEKLTTVKDRETSPEDHKAALTHFASQYKMAKMNGQEDKANEYSKSYHDYAAKLDKHYHDKLKESTVLEKRGLWDNIHAKRARIKAGSGEKMRKPGSKGAPTKQDFIDAQENFMDGRNPQDKGDMARHGLRGKTISQLKKIRSSDSASPRKKQLAHWYINMHKK